VPADAGVPRISSDSWGRRPFIQAAYVDGQLQASILDCPLAVVGVGCAISRHDRRHRKTGPAHSLAVLRCHVHQHSFTVYPLGFVPYARRQLVDGPVQHDEPSLMQAIDITAIGGAHDRTANDDPIGSWSTQLRLVDLVSRLFGLGSLDDSLRVSNAFAVPLADLVAAADIRGVCARATALRALAADLALDDLLALGALMGCWGQPHRWNMARQVLVPLPLCRGPPTNSGRGASPPGR
jgi:hypothetical protein